MLLDITCWAGSSIRVLHKWTQDRFYQCSYAGKKNWMTPACEECDGNHDAEIESLDKTDRWYNYGIEAIVEALRKELEDETTE